VSYPESDDHKAEIRANRYANPRHARRDLRILMRASDVRIVVRTSVITELARFPQCLHIFGRQVGVDVPSLATEALEFEAKRAAEDGELGFVAGAGFRPRERPASAPRCPQSRR